MCLDLDAVNLFGFAQFFNHCIVYLLAMQARRLLLKFYKWRIRRIKDRTFIMLVSAVIGVLAGFAAVIIKNLVHLISSSLDNLVDFIGNNYLYLFLPLIGLLLVLLFVKYLLRRKVDHGIPTVLYSISKRHGRIRPHNMYSSIIASSITVGFGGSVGLEGPTLATGSALGSNISRLLRLNYRQVILILGCAAAGAMSAIFKAPIAAVVFALEVIMINFTLTSVIPLLISSVMGALTSYLFLGQSTLYSVDVLEGFELSNLHFYAVLGIITALASFYFTRVYIFIAGLFERINSDWSRWIIGGTILGVLILLFPSLYGEGYDVINGALNGNMEHLFSNSIYEDQAGNFTMLLVVLLMVILFKAVATSVTFGAGGIGGVFAPSLFVGANTGWLFALFTNNLGANLPEKNFALVGMGGLISGVIHAPLTGIFLIAEITDGYSLLLPLMITATISYTTVRWLQPTSVYTYQLARRGELFTHDKDKTVLSLMDVTHLVETNFSTVPPTATLGELVQVISRSKRNIFPVIDNENNFLGVVWVNDIRHIVFNHELYETTFVQDLMFMPEPSVAPDESMEAVASKFQNSAHYNLPVLEDGKYVGFVSRANVFSKYRTMIKEFSED